MLRKLYDISVAFVQKTRLNVCLLHEDNHILKSMRSKRLITPKIHIYI